MAFPAPFLRRLAAFLVPLFVAAGVHAALPAGVTQGPSIEGVTEYRLANGLTVLLFPDASKPTTTVNVTYQVGSAHENYGETGMAHLLEHLRVQGHADARQHPDRARQARHAVQRLDQFRPHQLLRVVHGQRRRTSTGRWRWKRTGWSIRTSARATSTPK